jgi:hypothetical protein
VVSGWKDERSFQPFAVEEKKMSNSNSGRDHYKQTTEFLNDRPMDAQLTSTERRIDKTPKPKRGSYRRTTVIDFGHEEVLRVLADHIKETRGIVVDIKQFKLMLTEGRTNEGYSGPGPDQPAHIDSIYVEIEEEE